MVTASRSASDMKMYGAEGDGEGAFCRPQGITTDNEGHILVCDSRNNRIQVGFFLFHFLSPQKPPFFCSG